MVENPQLRACPVLLAGGQSRRMGRDKAQLRMPTGQTLIALAESLLQGLSTPPGVQFLPPLISGRCGGGVADRLPDRGPLGGLHSVAEHLWEKGVACDALLAIPVDMPNLRAVQLESLCAAGSVTGDSALCFGRCHLPLWLRLDDRSRAYLGRTAEGGGDSSVGALLRTLGGRQLEMPAGDWHLNINRPRDFHFLCRGD